MEAWPTGKGVKSNADVTFDVKPLGRVSKSYSQSPQTPRQPEPAIRLGVLRQTDIHFRPLRVGTHERDFTAMRPRQFSSGTKAKPGAGHPFISSDPIEPLE